MMITAEQMNTALAAVGLCWSASTKGPTLVDANTPKLSPSPTARNVETLSAYAALADLRGKTAAAFAAAARLKYDGDSSALDAISAGPGG